MVGAGVAGRVVRGKVPEGKVKGKALLETGRVHEERGVLCSTQGSETRCY